MDRERYLRVVLAEMKRYRRDQVALIISLDRRMNVDVVRDCVRIALQLKTEGERVVGIDLCGDPTVGDMKEFLPCVVKAKKAGLGVTLHIAEVWLDVIELVFLPYYLLMQTVQNTPEEALKLLSCLPDRLGHATFLTEDAISTVLEKKICIEICLSSNLLYVSQ